MAIAITVRADNAIVVYDEDDPRSGVVIDGPSEITTLINALTNTATGLYGDEVWKRARMQALAEAVADYDERLN
jgi:hypothetical protein